MGSGPICTDCEGTGITIQTERVCACQPRPSIGQTIAARLGELRKQRQLSLQAVADRAGLTKSHIWEIEQGRSINPTISAAIAIASALGVSLDYLCGLSTTLPNLHPEALRIACEVDALLRAKL